MQTKNSLYDIAAPYVTYYVNAKTNVLTRLESAREIKLPITYENENFIMVDTLIKEVTGFNYYTNTIVQKDKKKQAIDKNSTKEVKASKSLIYLESKLLKEPMLFELSK
jgi:beta-glucosidase/6-phospho-beta-glucosidase/beta-galactosidase